MKDKQSILRRIINSDITLIILSVILSIVIWAVVKINFSETATKTLTNVTVTLDSALAQENSFYPYYDEKDMQVDVLVSGKSYDINSKAFSAGDIIVTASGGYVDSSGYKVLTLNATTTNPDITVSSVSPSTVTVFFDRRASRTVDVEATLRNDLSSLAADGYTLGSPAASFSTVEVEGPASVVSELNKVIFTAEVNENNIPLKETVELPADVEFVMNNNRGAGFLQCKGIDESVPATVTVPVSREITVKSTVNFVNLPSGISADDVKVKIEPTKVKLTLSGETDEPESIAIGTIDFRSLSNKVNHFTFDTDENSAYSNISATHFNVSVDLSGYKRITLERTPTNIVFTSQNKEINYSVVNVGNLNSITVIGTAEVLESVTEENLQVEVNVSALESGAESVKCIVSNITINDADSCWVSGEYYCYVSVG